jgi:hypothetical protein
MRDIASIGRRLPPHLRSGFLMRNTDDRHGVGTPGRQRPSALARVLVAPFSKSARNEQARGRPMGVEGCARLAAMLARGHRPRTPGGCMGSLPTAGRVGSMITSNADSPRSETGV